MEILPRRGDGGRPESILLRRYAHRDAADQAAVTTATTRSNHTVAEIHMGKRLPAEDLVVIQNLIGKYQWLVDEGNADEWAELYTEDGLFDGGATQRFVGREQLKQVPLWVKSSWNGLMRHHAGSAYIECGASDDEAVARYYNFVTSWTNAEPKMFTFALSELHLVRQDDDWKIKRHYAKQLLAPRELGATK